MFGFIKKCVEMCVPNVVEDLNVKARNLMN